LVAQGDIRDEERKVGGEVDQNQPARGAFEVGEG
jgi:hypothetical protein